MPGGTSQARISLLITLVAINQPAGQSSLFFIIHHTAGF